MMSATLWDQMKQDFSDNTDRELEHCEDCNNCHDFCLCEKQEDFEE